jgi:hypothetical protein
VQGERLRLRDRALPRRHAGRTQTLTAPAGALGVIVTCPLVPAPPEVVTAAPPVQAICTPGTPSPVTAPVTRPEMLVGGGGVGPQPVNPTTRRHRVATSILFTARPSLSLAHSPPKPLWWPV